MCAPSRGAPVAAFAGHPKGRRHRIRAVCPRTTSKDATAHSLDLLIARGATLGECDRFRRWRRVGVRKRIVLVSGPFPHRAAHREEPISVRRIGPAGLDRELVEALEIA